ncbi:MAG: hypothetical protein GF416_08400 [Candidatus Altiarchaeales archaeon]|nr:hypothetical protein [Candidatus Altiarchaeales archaeon]MBD3417135.1 hypothetical protein [Candidatus Altiarchaeales archaeon]
MGDSGGYAVDIQAAGVEACARREWLLTNGLGGYSSSSVLGLNTRKYHGLLVSSRDDLQRRVVLDYMLEEVESEGEVHSLGVVEYGDTLDDRGFNCLRGFTYGFDRVRFSYEVGGLKIEKVVAAVEGVNALTISYDIINDSGSTSVFSVRPLVNSRGFHEINPMGREFNSSVHGENILSAWDPDDHLMFFSEAFTPQARGSWYRNLKYRLEDERGEQSIEDLFCPGVLSLEAGAGDSLRAEVFVAAGEDEQSTAEAFKSIRPAGSPVLGSDSLSMLRWAGDSFIVDSGGYRTVIAGYHWFQDWGRDTMISLPGLTLVSGRLGDARAILARFIDNIRDGRIPTRFEGGTPKYYGYDGTLWMIDRVKEYTRYAGVEEALKLVAPRWDKITSVIDFYSGLSEDGLISHRSGTWMDTLPRDDAVEIQCLWYNALNVVEGLSVLVNHPVDYSRQISDFESSFMDAYWNGQYLDDCRGDGSLRPNQVIGVSLDYSPVPDREASQLMKVVEEELLTPCGLRTLASSDTRYCPRYVGGVDERARAYHNGTVWPWLIGPYVRAAVKLGGDAGREHAQEILQPLINRVSESSIGSLNEIYDAEDPYSPRGAVSQAWSVAEVLRAYSEDVAGERPR